MEEQIKQETAEKIISDKLAGCIEQLNKEPMTLGEWLEFSCYLHNLGNTIVQLITKQASKDSVQ